MTLDWHERRASLDKPSGNEHLIMPGDQSLLVRELLMVWHQWPVIALCIGIALAGAWAFNSWARPVYTAEAVVAFEIASGDSRVRLLDASRRVAEEAAVLRSRELAELAVRAAPENVAKELLVSAPGTGVGRILGEIRDRLGLEGRVDRSHLAAVERFRQRLVVAEEPSPSTWLRLTFTVYDQRAAAPALNEILVAYRQDAERRQVAMSQESRLRAEQQVEARAEAVDEALRALTQGRKEGRDPFARRALAQKTLATLEDQLARATADTLARRVRYGALSGLDDAALAGVGRREGDPELLAVDARFQAAQDRFRSLSLSLGDQHPEMVAAKAELDGASLVKKERLAAFRDAARVALRQATETEASLRRAIAQAEHDASASEAVVAEMAVDREKAAGQQRRLSQSIERSLDEIAAFELKVIQPPETPLGPSSPRRGSNLTAALVYGLLVGLGLGGIRERLNRKVMSATDVKSMGVALLGLVPTVVNPIALLRQSATDPSASLLEAYRKVQTYLDRGKATGSAWVFLVSSTSAGEGKTTTAASLAILMAQKGLRVLLIDADLRRPTLTRYFQAKVRGGLAQAVAAGSLEPFVTTVADRLDLLASEAVERDAPLVLGGESLRKLLRLARERYDYVICDAPPLLPVVDALLLMPLVDGLILVAAAGRTYAQGLWDALEHIRSRHGNLIGVVLNRVDFRGIEYRHYGKYSYKNPTPRR
jgi:succinoglycan biosynthesis transport protein ExoP